MRSKLNPLIFNGNDSFIYRNIFLDNIKKIIKDNNIKLSISFNEFTYLLIPINKYKENVTSINSLDIIIISEKKITDYNLQLILNLLNKDSRLKKLNIILSSKSFSEIDFNTEYYNILNDDIFIKKEIKIEKLNEINKISNPNSNEIISRNSNDFLIAKPTNIFNAMKILKDEIKKISKYSKIMLKDVNDKLYNFIKLDGNSLTEDEINHGYELDENGIMINPSLMKYLSKFGEVKRIVNGYELKINTKKLFDINKFMRTFNSNKSKWITYFAEIQEVEKLITGSKEWVNKIYISGSWEMDFDARRFNLIN